MSDVFNPDGTYSKTEWKTGDRISSNGLNKIETALDTINNKLASLKETINNQISEDLANLEGVINDQISEKVNNLEEAISNLESTLTDVDETLTELDTKVNDKHSKDLDDLKKVVNDLDDTVGNLEKAIDALIKLEAERNSIENNRFFVDAFEWRFEFPEVLNDEGDFVGFDVVIGNPPYIRQEELKDFKNYPSVKMIKRAYSLGVLYYDDLTVKSHFYNILKLL